MARRTKEAAAVTREQLLDAAERVFRERGVAGSTLGEVAAQAGVTRGAVYWHFRDKSDLYAAMCERATLPLQTMVERAGISPHADPMAALRELALTALARLAGDTRAQAIARMDIALSEMVVEGVLTNIPLHRELMRDVRFIEGGTSIHYLEHKLSQRP